MRDIPHFIDGEAVHQTGGTFGDVYNPSTGEVQARVGLAAEPLVGKAVDAALRAQPAWAATNPQRRARVMFEFKRLVEAHMDELAPPARQASTARWLPTRAATCSAGWRSWSSPAVSRTP